MVELFLNEKLGVIKPLNCVNNGPRKYSADQTLTNFNTFKDLQIPYVRNHDASFCANYGGPHTVDVYAIFPDFTKDENDAENYDFTLTDEYLTTIKNTGAQTFYRLGHRIEHTTKKYGVFPPVDFGKWARVCEHIIRHFNEKWANGYELGLMYWEIWNEPDLHEEAEPSTRATWTGTRQQFFELYDITARHLKKCFPDLKIGGPALAYNLEWAEDFLKNLTAPLDFFSWHIYTENPTHIFEKARKVRNLLDKYGYQKTESHCNEWNYVKDWGNKFVESLKVIHSLKGASFCTACMTGLVYEPLDMFMYYDARLGTSFNGIFEPVTLEPLKTYYVFKAFTNFYKGQALKVDCTDENIYVAAAEKDGEVNLLLTDYADENCNDVNVTVKLNGLKENKKYKVEVFALDDARDLESVFTKEVCGKCDKINLQVVAYSTQLVKITCIELNANNKNG